MTVRDAGVLRLRLASNRKDAGQPGEPVAAKQVIDQLVGDDAGIVFAVSDADKRTFAESPRVANAESHGVWPVWR
jgi:hypothetical protein